MNISGTVPLDSESLIAAAIRTTGLSDFGVDDWREPFEILCKSLEEDAGLNLLGESARALSCSCYWRLACKSRKHIRDIPKSRTKRLFIP